VERSVGLALRGPGTFTYHLALPVEFQVEAGVEGVQVSVELRVSYRGGKGQMLVRDLAADTQATAGPAAEAAPRKAGFFARLFGKG
jgi:hypothetical protein